MNIFIPTSVDRKKNILWVCRSLKEAIKYSTYTVQTIVIDASQEPTLKEEVLKYCNSYIHIPSEIYNLIGNIKQYPKSFIQNIGFLLTPEASWNIFHDSDIVVPSDFFQVIGDVIFDEKNPIVWAVLYKNLTRLKEFPNDYSDIWTAEGETTSTEIGGCVAVKSCAFRAIGGYDSECFFGYSPEDRMFKLKLQLFHSLIQIPQLLFHLPHEHQPVYHWFTGFNIYQHFF